MQKVVVVRHTKIMVVKKRTGKGGEAAAGPKNGHAHASSSNKTQKKKKSPEDATEGRYNVGWWGLVGILSEFFFLLLLSLVNSSMV